jgi:peptidyl-prolyl cis-trans isomerase SurA
MTKISKGTLVLGLTLACVLQLFMARLSVAEIVDRIVAEVNDEIITMSELVAATKSLEAQVGVNPKGKLNKEIERQTLETLIDRKLAKVEAKRRGIKVEDKELNAAMADLRKRNHLENDEAFKTALAKAGISLKELRQNIADQIIQQRLLTVAVKNKAMVNVSDAEVRRFYDEKYHESGVKLHLRGIQLPFPSGITEAQKEELKKKAETIMADVKNGASFQAAANKQSLSVTDLGFVSENDLDPRLAQFLTRLKPKEVAPALTPKGIQLFQLVERRSGERRPFEEVAPQIRQALAQQAMAKEFHQWVKTLRAKAHIKIML